MEVLTTAQQRIAGVVIALACLAVAFVLPLSPDAIAWPDNTVWPEDATAKSDDEGEDSQELEDDSAIEPLSVRDQFIDALNELRDEHDLAPLRPLSSMHDAALDWTEEMVENSRLAHADVIYTGLGNEWKFAGENVGRGLTVESLMAAFMESETHRANILDSRFTHVGVATMLHDDGRIYTTHRFAQFDNIIADEEPTEPTRRGTRRGARQLSV